jgi:hypothetical protein
MYHGRPQEEPKNKKRKLSVTSKETITRTSKDDPAPHLYELVVLLKDEPNLADDSASFLLKYTGSSQHSNCKV